MFFGFAEYDAEKLPSASLNSAGKMFFSFTAHGAENACRIGHQKSSGNLCSCPRKRATLCNNKADSSLCRCLQLRNHEPSCRRPNALLCAHLRARLYPCAVVESHVTVHCWWRRAAASCETYFLKAVPREEECRRGHR